MQASRSLVIGVLALLAGFVPGYCDPPAWILDLAAVSDNDDRVRRVYGSTGQGFLGLPVAGGGDCDGDGFEDYAVGSFLASPFGRGQAGEVLLAFGDGTTRGFVDTAQPDPDVLRIAGDGNLEITGSEIWIDDVTGDGIADLLIARQNFSPTADRAGAGALTVLAGGPRLRARAATLSPVDLRTPPPNLSLVTFVGDESADRLGIWMRTGDVTGDGIADIVVGADQEDDAGLPGDPGGGSPEGPGDGEPGGPGDLPTEHNRGAAYLIRGGAHLATSRIVDLRFFGSTELAGHVAKLIPPAGSAGYHFGATCQIGDLDGNGRSEVLVAATLARSGASVPADGLPGSSAESTGGAPNGEIYIAWDDNFPAGSWPAGYAFDLAAAPGTTTVLRGAEVNVRFGEEILAGRDYDRDGRADLFIGDLTADATPARVQAGLGHVIYNAAALRGLDVNLDNPPGNLRMTTILGPETGAIGSDTAAHGDFDGDGFDDLMIASPTASPLGRLRAGVLHVLFGRAGGWPAVIDTALGALPPAGQVRVAEVRGARGSTGNDRGDTLGYSSAPGDADGDGRTDLVVNEMVGNGLAPNTIDVGNLIVVNGRALTEPVEIPPCEPGPSRLCLQDDRFQVEVTWRDFENGTGTGQVVLGSRDSGLFWFFEESNWEMLVKVLDGCGFNDHFWVFSAATTNVEYTLRVTDTQTGESRLYRNPLGTSAEAVTDVEAFAACP